MVYQQQHHASCDTTTEVCDTKGMWYGSTHVNYIIIIIIMCVCTNTDHIIV